MHLVFDRKKGLLLPDWTIWATSLTRTIANGERASHEVVYTDGTTVPNGLPYMPEPFPAGIFNILSVEKMDDDSLFWPYLIRTDAERVLPVWELDEHERYLRPSARTFVDRGLHIHHARYKNKDGILVPSRTTHGCINGIKPGDVTGLALRILDLYPSGIVPRGKITMEAKA